MAYVQEVGRAMGFVVANYAGDDFPDDYTPFALQPVQKCSSPVVYLAEIFGAELDTSDPQSFPIEAGTLDVIEALRRCLWGVNGGSETCRVGGAAELTTATGAGIATRTLRIWEGDRVGCVITPQRCSSGYAVRSSLPLMPFVRQRFRFAIITLAAVPKVGI